MVSASSCMAFTSQASFVAGSVRCVMVYARSPASKSWVGSPMMACKSSALCGGGRMWEVAAHCIPVAYRGVNDG